MSNRQSTGLRLVFSASAIQEAIAADLLQIKQEDGLTFADLGAVLGVSEDQAAKYCDCLATMNAVTFARGKREWGGRFTGGFDRLCELTRPGLVNDYRSVSCILRAAEALSVALEDGAVDPEEVRACRAKLEAARDAIDQQLRKLVRAA